MEKIEGLPVKICVLVLAVVFLLAGVVACGKSTNDTTYKLTHSAADAEYILITRRAEFHGLCPWVNE